MQGVKYKANSFKTTEFDIISSVIYLEVNYICLALKTASSVFDLFPLCEPDIHKPFFFKK